VKQGFMLYHSDLHAIDNLAAEDFKMLVLALLNLSENGEEANLGGSASMAFRFMAEKVLRDQQKYNKICEQNRIKGLNSAAIRESDSNSGQPHLTTVDNGQPMQPTVTVTATEAVTVTEAGTVTGAVTGTKSSAKRFTPPTLDEIQTYCQERGNNVDTQVFIDFYISKGWRIGNQPMKDWKAAVRTWEQRDGGKGKQTNAQKGKKRLEEARTKLRLAGKHEEAAKLTMNDLEGLS
jgi:hypothetical protein